MGSVTLIFPHQLFRKHPSVSTGKTVFLVEETLYFNQFRFHKKKLVLHRASMKWYGNYLSAKGHAVEYIEAADRRCDVRKLVLYLASKGIRNINFAAPADDWLERRVRKAAAASGLACIVTPTPAFLNSPQDVADHFNRKRTYFQTDFYTWQRKKRNILMKDGQPAGGKWTFDTENRSRFPKGEPVPRFQWVPTNEFVAEAIRYVESNFPDNPGTTENFGYPVTFEDAEWWLEQFLDQRFSGFGTYEDAMVKKENTLFHSLLSPLLNTGLLEPSHTIQKALIAAESRNIPLNSAEGFIRQILGWREFIHIVYDRDGRKQRTSNYFNFTRRIPASFWDGITGIGPVDQVIRHTLRDGYTHHINRLMVLGNFMLLCEFDPNQVYRWFMEMYVDAYDWVMVPNVYGMSQFADGGLMTTKPYISGSNYLMKMGDWDKGPWQEIWDSLFWRFMHVHRELFARNPRLSMLLATFDKMDKKKQDHLLSTAETYLNSLDHPVTTTRG